MQNKKDEALQDKKDIDLITYTTDEIGLVPPPDFSLIRPDDFSDEDYICPPFWPKDDRGTPYYFFHFHKIANAVRLEEPHRGFIDLPVHRNTAHNYPYNARVQENHLWLTYFYTHSASWNIYYGMPEVKFRLEAMLEHLLSLQNSAGAFSEYAWEDYNLPGTTFAVQFLSHSVRLLKEAQKQDPNFPGIEKGLYDQVIRAYYKALVHVLDHPHFWKHGKSFTNQYTLMWSATAAYLKYFPNAELEEQMKEKFMKSVAEFRSPAGFYYEADAYDMGYNLGVHLKNLIADDHYFRNTELEQKLIEDQSLFFEWLSYNLVLEPDGSHFTSNAGPSSRTEAIHVARKDIPLSEKLPLARAFVKTQEEVKDEIRRAKERISKNGTWPNVPELPLVGDNSYNPYGLYSRILNSYFPTEEERSEAIKMLPYIKNNVFNHQRIDDRSGLEFTYVRRPEYYASFNAGQRKSVSQVFGLGLIWHPEAGLIMSSQTEGLSSELHRNLSWGTKKDQAPRVYENGDVLSHYILNGEPFDPVVGASDLAKGEIGINYKLGVIGNKTIVFEEDGIRVKVIHPDEFTEHLPLMIGSEDRYEVNDRGISLFRGKTKLEIAFDETVVPQIEQQNYNIFAYQMHMLTLSTRDQLSYLITLSNS